MNCDMGESFGSWSMGQDEQVMEWIDKANIACGFHAGDPHIMNRTVQLASDYCVEIGAHPSYQDLLGFGRRSIPHTPSQITELVLYQVGSLQAFCRYHQTSLNYIKPHGALYNDMMKDMDIFRAVVQAAACFRLPLMVLASGDNQRYLDIADNDDVPLLFEAFADRRYQDDGTLTPRDWPNAVLSDETEILAQVRQLANEGSVTTASGNKLAIEADTLCVHGDNPSSIELIERIWHTLNAE
nr:5-oxoprolinase subunit PxpA [Vibrio agarilyticus]